MGVERFDQKKMMASQDTLRADYAAAKMNRFRRLRTGMLTTIGSGADYHYRIQSDYLRMMEYARDMDRNDMVIGQAIDRAVLNTIQEGLTVDPQTGDEKLNADLRDRFNGWGEDPDECDIAGEATFADMQHMAMRACFVDGDITAIPMQAGTLQLNEAHRLRTPGGTQRNVVHGILLNDYRKPLEYWFTKNDVDPMQAVQLVSEILPTKARDEEGYKNVFHVYSPKRVSQTRGVTALAPCFDVAGMLDDINFSAVVRQQIANVFALIRERSVGFTQANTSPLGTVTQEPMAGGTVRQLQNVSPGMEIAGAVGETLKLDGSKVPSNEFFQHIKLMLTLVGINLGMPLILMLMDASETNFSGWRGAFDQAKLGFKHNQKWFSRKFCRPTYIWKLRQFCAEDRILAKQAGTLQKRFFEHRWNAPRWPYIQPLQDAQADAMRVEKRLTSPRRSAAERGIEYVDLIKEVVEDNKAAIALAVKAAKAIEADTQQVVDWHELLFIQNPAPIRTIAQDPNPVGDQATGKKPPLPGAGGVSKSTEEDPSKEDPEDPENDPDEDDEDENDD